MSLFKNQDGALTLINAVQPQSEKVLQRLIEGNLKDVLDMYFIASEFRTPNGRIDTLAIDSDGAPVIIEYKRNKNDNVINQALSYLRWLTAQQPEFFEMLMQKHLPREVFENLRLDWKHPRVICIAQSFNKYDTDTVEIIPLRIELFRFRMYESGLLNIEPVTFDEMPGIGELKHISADNTQSSITANKEQSNASHLVATLFDELRERIMGLDQYVLEKAGKRGFSYRLTKIFVEVLIRKDRLIIVLRPIDYIDPLGMVEKFVEGYTVTLNRRVTMTLPSELDYVFSIVEQSYQNVL